MISAHRFFALRGMGTRFYAVVTAFETAPSWPDSSGTKSIVLHWLWRTEDSDWIKRHSEVGERRSSCRPTPRCAWQANGVRGGGSDPSSGPRRLVRTPVAVHLLPLEKVAIIAGRAHARRTMSLSAGERGDRKAVGEGSLRHIPDQPSESFHHFPHELARVLQHHRIRNPQQSNAEESPPMQITFKRPTRGCAWQANDVRGGGSDPLSGPRRLVRTPVAVHLLPLEKVGPIWRTRARRTISFSLGEGRNHCGARARELPSLRQAGVSLTPLPLIEWHDARQKIAD